MGLLNGNGNSADVTASPGPAVLRIGVTGHRKLENPDLIGDGVRAALGKLDEMLARELRNTPYTFMVISPLAEGSDRLVAREVLSWRRRDDSPVSYLEVVLPMSEELYMKDFESAASVAEFQSLVARAGSVIEFNNRSSRDAAYESDGRYVVDNCDVLIAVWNGKSAAGRGGTGDVVAYSRASGHSLIWIDSSSGQIHYEWGDREKWLEPFRKLKAGCEKIPQ